MALEFVILPLSFYLGAAGQAAGLYLFGILFAAFYGLRRSGLSPQMQTSMFAIGLLLLAMHLLFPLINLVVQWNPPSDWPATAQAFVENRTAKQFLESQFSSAVALVGVALTLLGKFDFASLHKPHLAEEFRNKPLLPYSSFFYGLFLGTMCFLAYAIFQNVTGYDMRATSRILLPEHQLPNGLYRVFGFFGHPLSLSSVGLAMFVFCGSLIAQADDKMWSKDIQALLMLCCLANLYFVFAGGGRSALVIAVVALFYFAVRIKHSFLKKVRPFLLLGSVVAATLMLVGVFSRFHDFVPTGGNVPDRLQFWKVHWNLFLQSPIVGQGHFWLDSFRRLQFYENLGLGHMRDKFSAHNLYLEVLANTGAVGFAALSVFVFQLRLRIKKALDVSPQSRLFAKALFASVLANLVHGITQETFFDSNVSSVYLGLLLIGIWCAVYQENTVLTPETGLRRLTP